LEKISNCPQETTAIDHKNKKKEIKYTSTTPSLHLMPTTVLQTTTKTNVQPFFP
jgi:hypothetical protein